MTQLYGVDLKITEQDGELAAKLIELNGIQFGTKSFMLTGDEQYYNNFMRTVSKGKSVFIKSYTPKTKDDIKRTLHT